jgi:cytochrome-b5 reductase
MAPGAAKGTGPYGLGAYNPRDPLSRLGGTASMPQRPAIDQLAWRRYELISIAKVNHNTSIFRFQVPHKAKLDVGMGKHLSVSTSINNKTTKREYTPITDEPGYFELLVKHYENGPLSSYIHTLKVGDGALMRGLFGNLDVKPNKWKTLYMFAAGTGIAPMIPFIKYFSMICQKEAQDAKTASAAEETDAEKKKPISYPKVATRVHLLFANKTESDILLGSELEKHAKVCNGLLTIDYLLSQAEAVPETSNSSLAYTVGRISDSTMKSIYNMTQDAFTECKMETGPLESTFSLVCGPDGFVASVKVLLETVWRFPESHYHAF